jgi:hypothetical protein
MMGLVKVEGESSIVSVRIPTSHMQFVRALSQFSGVKVEEILSDMLETEINCEIDEYATPYVKTGELRKLYGFAAETD